MDSHKGHLLVKSEGEGCGTTFTLLLPVVKPTDIQIQDPENLQLNDDHFYNTNDNSKSDIASTCVAMTAAAEGKAGKVADIFSKNHTYIYSSNDMNVANLENVDLELSTPNHNDVEPFSTSSTHNNDKTGETKANSREFITTKQYLL